MAICQNPKCGGVIPPERAVHGSTKYCSESCRYRVSYDKKRKNPDYVQQCKDRAALWYLNNKEHHKNRRRDRIGLPPCPPEEPTSDVWNTMPPDYGPYLPGGGLDLQVTPRPKWEIQHRNARVLHGMLTACIGMDHGRHVPNFSLVPWNNKIGWALYVHRDEVAMAMAGRRIASRFATQDVSVMFSALSRVKTPKPVPGKSTLRIDTITPVCTRRDLGRGKVYHERPSESSLVNAIGDMFQLRLGVRVPLQQMALRILSLESEPISVPCGGKFRRIKGWHGHVIVEVNPVTRWLLECASRIGFGGKTGLGFGRVVVSEVLTDHG